MPSLKYVIELSAQDKAELIDIVTKGKRTSYCEKGLEATINRKKGYSRWTLRLLADKAVELGYIESISHVTISTILKKTNLSPI